MTDQFPDNEQKQEPPRITHYMLPNRSLIPIDGYLIPERTWVIIRDALQNGTWGEWEEWINEETSHPDIPSISELRSSLWRAGLREQAIRDLVLLAVVIRDRVYREVHDNLNADELPSNFEPLNIQPVDSLLDIVDGSSVASEIEIEYDHDDSDDDDDDDDTWQDDDDDDDNDQPTLFPPSRFGSGGFGRLSGFSRDESTSNQRDPLGPIGNRFGGANRYEAQRRQRVSGLISHFGSQNSDSSSHDNEMLQEQQRRLDTLGVEQSNIKQVLLMLVAINLVIFVALLALVTNVV